MSNVRQSHRNSSWREIGHSGANKWSLNAWRDRCNVRGLDLTCMQPLLARSRHCCALPHCQRRLRKLSSGRLLRDPSPRNRERRHPLRRRCGRQHQMVGTFELEVPATNLIAEIGNAIDFDVMEHITLGDVDLLSRAVRAHEVNHRP